MSDKVVSIQDASTDSHNAFRSEIISIVLRWAKEQSEGPAMALDVVNDHEFSRGEGNPPALIEYNVVRALPVVNQHLKNDQTGMRIAPLNTPQGVELIRFHDVD